MLSAITKCQMPDANTLLASNFIPHCTMLPLHLALIPYVISIITKSRRQHSLAYIVPEHTIIRTRRRNDIQIIVPQPILLEHISHCLRASSFIVAHIDAQARAITENVLDCVALDDGVDRPQYNKTRAICGHAAGITTGDSVLDDSHTLDARVDEGPIAAV